MALADVLRTKRGRQLAFVTAAGLTVIFGVRASQAQAARRRPTFTPQQYPPGSPSQFALFLRAARAAGVPEEWAVDRNLVKLLRAESDGWVGRPNYQYGDDAKDKSRWPLVHAELRAGQRRRGVSSATGLGQLILGNVDTYYPNGRAGIGDPLNEAVGMLRYIAKRYGTPAEAWRCYRIECPEYGKTFAPGY